MELDKKNKIDHVENLRGYAVQMLKQRIALYYRKQKTGWVEFLLEKEIEDIPSLLLDFKPKKLGKRKLVFHFANKKGYADIWYACRQVNLPIAYDTKKGIPKVRTGGAIFISGDARPPEDPEKGPTIIERTADSKQQSGLREIIKGFKDMKPMEKIKHAVNHIGNFEDRFDLETILYKTELGDFCRELIASVICKIPGVEIAKEMKISQPTVHRMYLKCLAKAKSLVI